MRSARLVPVILVLVLLGTAPPIASTASASTFPGANGKIAFQRDTGIPAIYVMDADGSNPHRIAASGADTPAPSWSADGRRLVYVAVKRGRTGIFVSDARGRHRKQLTKSDSTGGEPTWSPDGTKIAFTRYGDSADIWVMNANGKHPVNLTKTADVDEDEPTWSPDGTKIAFTSLSHTPTDDIVIRIEVMNADGTDIRPLTSAGSVSSPSWSPDGSRIAYQVTIGDVVAQIYVMDADGSNPVDLTGGQGVFFAPSWSPDGTKIVFHTARHDNAFDSQIWVMDADGTNQVALTDELRTIDRHASWQPIPAG